MARTEPAPIALDQHRVRRWLALLACVVVTSYFVSGVHATDLHTWSSLHNKQYGSQQEAQPADSTLTRLLKTLRGSEKSVHTGVARQLKGCGRDPCNHPKNGCPKCCPFKPDPPINTGGARNNQTPPVSLDWTKNVSVTVKSQGDQCSSGWAFSAISAIEYALGIVFKTPKVPALSTQIIVDCATRAWAGPKYLNISGCDGGTPDRALKFAVQFTVPLDKSYPYKNVSGRCNTNMINLPWDSPTGWVKTFNPIYLSLHEYSMQQELVNQPLIIYWNTGYNWFSYTSGIYTLAQQQNVPDGCTQNLSTVNHAMLVVGYDATPNKTQYWIIQNSYGTSWGIKGFAKVEMTHDLRGPCGMYQIVTAPSLTAPPHVPSGFITGRTGENWQPDGSLTLTPAIPSCPFTADPISSIATSPDGQLLAAGLCNGTVAVWALATRQLIAILNNHKNRVTSVMFSGDNVLLASGSADTTISLWNVNNFTLITTLTGHTSTVNCLAFAPNGTLLASGSGDSLSSDTSVRLWKVTLQENNNPPTVSALGKLNSQTYPRSITALAFTLDSGTLVVGSQDGNVYVFSMTRVPYLLLPSWQNGHQGGINSLAVSPDPGKLVATAGSDWIVRLWNLSRVSGVADPFLVKQDYLHARPGGAGYKFGTRSMFGGMIPPFWYNTSHTGPVNSVAFSRDGKRLISGSNDSTVRVWDVATLNNTATLQGPGPITAVAFSISGYTIVAATKTGTLQLWKLM